MSSAGSIKVTIQVDAANHPATKYDARVTTSQRDATRDDGANASSGSSIDCPPSPLTSNRHCSTSWSKPSKTKIRPRSRRRSASSLSRVTCCCTSPAPRIADRSAWPSSPPRREFNPDFFPLLEPAGIAALVGIAAALGAKKIGTRRPAERPPRRTMATGQRDPLAAHWRATRLCDCLYSTAEQKCDGKL